VAYSIALPTKSGIDCTCMGGRFQKSRTVTAGDVLRFDKGNLQAQFAGHQLGASAWLNEKFSAFVFEREDFDAPTEFWMGLFAASPARNGYVEQADCIRKRVRWSPGSNGLEAYNSDTLEFVAGPGTWDVSSIGVWSGPDPFADDQPLLLWKRLPFGQRVVEQGEAVVIPKGEYKIG
jgi:hypothetical protein